MPRQAWVIVAGFPHHIVQRGHNRQPVFVERRDFEYFLANLREWKQVHEVEVYSYCLMTNRVHLVVQANDNVTVIPQLMKRLVGRQTRFLNALEKRSGSLWKGRYKISPIDTDAYRRFVECEGSSKSDERIASAINSNKLTGGEKFVDAI